MSRSCYACVCIYTDIPPISLYVCHIHVCSTQIWPAAKLRFLLLYFMLVLLLQSRALLLLVLLPKPGNETLMRVKLIQMRFLSACRCPSHCHISLSPFLPCCLIRIPAFQIGCTLLQVTAYAAIYISNIVLVPVAVLVRSCETEGTRRGRVCLLICWP